MAYEIIRASLFIIMAEIGDKTQMLSMAFARKYSLSKVLLGVFIGSILNHGLAALLGTYLSDVIPINIIRIFAAVAFIGFGLWSLKIEEEDKGEEGTIFYRFGPVLAIASAFFIGEMGDKTQLTVITLSSQARYPLLIVVGTVSGMVITSAIGVFIGSRLGKKIPELGFKIISASIFIIFGIIGLKDAVPSQYMTGPLVLAFMLVLVSIIFVRIRKLRNYADLGDTPYKKTAAALYLNTKPVQAALTKVCEKNHNCNGNECTIRCINNYLIEAGEKEMFISEEKWNIPLCREKSYEAIELKESLIETINMCQKCSIHHKNCVGNQTRINLEILCFGNPIAYKGNIEEYYAEVKKIDSNFFDKV